ncbi:MAG TPA: hypothetical protein VFA82_02020 [Gaiellaceae bacterium]|nr:hypothetical protein [Gaiellaceae bacterium]
MLLEHDLRIRLRERRDRLYRAGALEFERELERLLGWMESRPYIAAILAELEAADADYDSWSQGLKEQRRLTFPSGEAERTKLCLEICRRGDPDNLTRLLTSSHFEDLDRIFVEAFVDPVVNFVEDRLEEGGSILALLLRYQRRVEWFDDARLHAIAKKDPTLAAARLDADLRRYLLDSGVDYPFSRPSTRIDPLVGREPPPLALETRIFDPAAGADRAQLRDGFERAVALAQEHGRPAGYLVVFALARARLVFETSSPRGQVPAVRADGKRIFLISIHVNPNVAIDEETGRPARVAVGEAFLSGQAAVT